MKTKSFFVVSLAIVVACMVGIGVAFFSVATEINGYMSVSSASWDIHFENLKTGTKTENMEEIKKPVLTNNATIIEDINVMVKDLDSSITYEFDVVNAGGIDAVINTIQVKTPVCVGSGDKAQSDSLMVCENIGLELTYADGTEIKEGDVLLSGQKESIKLRLYYDGKELPYSEVNASNIGVAIIYIQS